MIRNLYFSFVDKYIELIICLILEKVKGYVLDISIIKVKKHLMKLENLFYPLMDIHVEQICY